MNADDFGLTSGVNRAILEFHRDGVLSSATLMARAAATDEAVSMALATPTLGVGCHVVLVDGEAVLPSNNIPTLIDPNTGRLFPKLGRFLKRLTGGQVSMLDIQDEAHAQIALLQNRGLRVTHIDTHKHTHMFPRVLRPVLRAARQLGIRAVRNPFEPAWSTRATLGAPWVRRAEVRLLHSLESRFLRLAAEEGFSTTSGALGVLATGTLTSQGVTSLLQAVPEGTWELVTHPGYHDDDLAHAGTRLLQSRETERKALQAIRNFPEVDLISYAEL